MSPPEWPAILKLEGIDELFYFSDAEQWQAEQSSLVPPGGDRLIDRLGRVFHVHASGLDATGASLSMPEFNEWVRAHLVAMQQCCVYKVELQNYMEGIRLVAETQENGPA